MKKLYFMGLLWVLCIPSPAQVGINTSDPKAMLDISSTSVTAPQITDGMLIPRIRNFPASNPTEAQHGMLVFLEEEKESFPVGFYFWDHTSGSWKAMANNSYVDFYKIGTSLPSENIEEAIYRTGNISVGGEAENIKLEVVIDPEENHLTRTGLKVDNSSSSPVNVTYGIQNSNRSITNDTKYGIKNYVSSMGRGIHYGIYTETYQSSVQDMYGIKNIVGRTYGASNNHYGIHTEIGTPLGTGMVYGIYSSAFGENPGRVYAGYFAGRLGIGFTEAEQYIFPGAKGLPGQILVLDAAGSMDWQYPLIRNYSSTGPATGSFLISDEMNTVEVRDRVNRIIIPEASKNKGRVITLLGWPGITRKEFSFSGGDSILDISTNTAITGIQSGERLNIQSNGDRWILISD